MIFVGDVHRNVDFLKSVVDNSNGEDVVALGDLGIGTIPEIDAAFMELFENSPNLYTIRGNHDHLDTIKKLDGFIHDGSVKQTNKGPMMFIGGEMSHDRADRTPGMDWWPDEENEIKKFYQFHQIAVNVNPTFLVTHDCPNFVSDHLHMMSNRDRTKDNLGIMYTRISPQLHIFGHHHVTWHREIGTTDFVCVGLDSTHRVEGMIFVDSDT